MSNYIVTGFDEKFWPEWGSSWVLSLKNTNPKNEVLIVDCGLSEATKKKIESCGFIVIPSLKNVLYNSYRINICFTALDFIKDKKSQFVYWDADSIFQENVDEIFDSIENKFIITKNKNPGLLGGCSQNLNLLRDVHNFLSFRNKLGLDSIVDSLYHDFKDLTNIIDETWNYVDITNISFTEDLKIKSNDKIPKVVHFSGDVKQSLENKKIFFHERYKEEHLDFLSNKCFNTRPIFKK